ncbi:uncharacterized protein TNCV_4140381 [Trichonephila clavipes]|nr:uncharacterized protein TNCV_4140381 [Trichonephila clavipes]
MGQTIYFNVWKSSKNVSLHFNCKLGTSAMRLLIRNHLGSKFTLVCELSDQLMSRIEVSSVKACAFLFLQIAFVSILLIRQYIFNFFSAAVRTETQPIVSGFYSVSFLMGRDSMKMTVWTVSNCPALEKIELRGDLKHRIGLAVSLEKICHNFGESTSTMASKISNKCYDINLKLTYGMIAIGKEKDLLKKCLHGRTQNPNESFNKCIWERIPKTVFVGIETLKFGVMDSVICFNDGYVSRIKVFEALGIKPGYNTERTLLIIDKKRIFEAARIVNKVSLAARN